MMQVLKALLIDDEAGNIIALKELIKEYCPTVRICGTANNIDDGYDLIMINKPDIVFLDIEMPRGNGFDLLDRISDINFEIIFVTAFDDYAIKAFKYSAIHYILKPISAAALQEAVNRAAEKNIDKKNNERISLLLQNLRQEDQTLHKISLPTINGLSFEDVNSIIYLKAEGSYTRVFTQKNKGELISRSLRGFEDILPLSVFCRIHHSYIINMNFVNRYFKGRGGYVEMSDGTEIEVSVRKKEEFLNKFK